MANTLKVGIAGGRGLSTMMGFNAIEGVEVASVEFSGMLGQGAAGGGYAPFREVWSMARPAEGQGAWRVAGIEPMAV